MAAPAALLGEVDHGAAAAQRLPERAPQIDPPARGIGLEAAGRHRLDRQLQPADQRLRLLDLGRRHLLEVLVLQDLAGGEAERRIELERRLGILLRLVLAGPFFRTKRLGKASRELFAGRRLAPLELRQQQLHHLLEQVGLAPEDVKGLVEQLALVAPVDEHRVQRPVEVDAAADPDRLDRPDRVQNLARPDRQPGRPQHAREMHDVGREPALARIFPRRTGGGRLIVHARKSPHSRGTPS